MIAVSSESYWEAFVPTLAMLAALLAILPWARREDRLVRAIAMGLALVLSWRYMFWRLSETIPWDGSWADLAVGSTFALLEALAMIGTSASMIFLTRISDRSRQADAAAQRLAVHPRPPMVDILICTYNEEKTILERTIVGALATEYRNHRIWVCDDGRRDWLRDLAELYGVGYLTRSDNAHAKAGNINAALKRLGALRRPPDFVCVLDADFVPTPLLVTRTLALMEEADVGIVQTPQHFFNPDPIQHNLGLGRVWPDEQRFFFDVVMASKDAWGGAFCCGTSSLIRFQALMEIGGFPTDSVTEDYLLSLRMRQNAYRTIYLNERLSQGLAPEGLAEYCVQRSRWCLGLVQICRGPSGPFRFGNRLPWIDRIMLTESFLNWSVTYLLRVYCICVPILYLLFNVQPVRAGVSDAISHAAPFVIVQMLLMSWLTQWRLLPIMSELYVLIPTLDILKAVWAGLMRPQGQKFRVTAKGVSRQTRVVQWPLLRIFLSALALTVVSVVLAFHTDGVSTRDAAGVALFWAWYNIVLLTLVCFACIEMDQRRGGDRFATNEPVEVVVEGVATVCVMKDISVTGARFVCANSVAQDALAVGARVGVRLGERLVAATVARRTLQGFAVAFDPGLAGRMAAIQYVFSGRYRQHDFAISPRAVAGAILERVFH